ncbi:MAG: hypothetical protein JRG96_03780 [Deltaproteobacteria bacterium]|nr:hypothetical protein [Deltaproteobacteria bacterium]
MPDEGVHGLKLVLAGDRSEAAWTPHGYIHPELRLGFSFENRGDRPLKLDLNQLAEKGRLRLDLSFDGERIESTPRMDRIPSAVPATAERVRTIDPGGSLEWTRDMYGHVFTLPEFGAQVFLFEKPGTYRIRAIYTKERVNPQNAFEAGCWVGSVVSNEITLEVSPDGGW